MKIRISGKRFPRTLVIKDVPCQACARRCKRGKGTLADFGVAKDIIVTTPEESGHRGRLVGTLLRPALREGKTLYARQYDSVRGPPLAAPPLRRGQSRFG